MNGPDRSLSRPLDYVESKLGELGRCGIRREERRCVGMECAEGISTDRFESVWELVDCEGWPVTFHRVFAAMTGPESISFSQPVSESLFT